MFWWVYSNENWPWLEAHQRVRQLPSLSNTQQGVEKRGHSKMMVKKEVREG